MLKKVIAATACLVASVTLSASAGGWSHPAASVKIESIYANAGWVMFSIEGPATVNPDGCSSTNYLALDANQAGFDVLYSAALTAFSAGQDVRFYLVGCGGQNSAYPQIVSVMAVK